MADSPRQYLHSLVLAHTGSGDDHLLADWDAWQASRRAAHGAALAACPDLGQNSA